MQRKTHCQQMDKNHFTELWVTRDRHRDTWLAYHSRCTCLAKSYGLMDLDVHAMQHPQRIPPSRSLASVGIKKSLISRDSRGGATP